MRLLIAAILGFAAIAMPAMAQQPPASGSAPHIFGSATCSQKVPCPESYASTTSADLAANANACLKQSLGLNNPGGFFEENLGLDANKCLTAKPNPAGLNSSKSITPQCCLTKLPDNTCAFHCQLTTASH